MQNVIKNSVAKDVFKRSILFGDDTPDTTKARITAFDVEILLIAKKRGYTIKEVPVTWNFGTQSKVLVFRDSINNLVDVLRIKANDLKGKYN